MILYNVTINVAPSVEKEWISWMKEIHIPEVLDTGCFVDHKFLKLLTESPEAEGNTFAVQYFALNKSDLDTYLANSATGLRQKAMNKFQDKCLSFRSVLEEL